MCMANTDYGMQCFKHPRPKSEGEGVRAQVWNIVASFPGPREGGENGLVSTVCACA